MPTVSRGLPEQPHLDIPRREARELLRAWRDNDAQARERVRRRHPRFVTDESATLRLNDAQLVVAREYGFASWTQLKQRIETNSFAQTLDAAIRAGERDTAVRLIKLRPELLHLPVISGNWGPPMSHAANLGRLEIIQAMAALGARDHQHAFERALLQGRIECARWLLANGAQLVPGIVMGCCETLDVAGFDFLLELGAPLTNEHSDALAPLALVLGTYARKPAAKRAILQRFAQRGYALPATPTMALHRGDISALERHLRRHPRLLERTFTLREIYPPELGCNDGDRAGMHWTPIGGTTLLHIAIDFREWEIFQWLLSHGADVNVRAAVDAQGFGGHTPLFNAAVNGPWPDSGFVASLLQRGADRNIRVNLRKFVDWCEQPQWHEARAVTPLEWARTFPDRGWINDATLIALEDRK